MKNNNGYFLKVCFLTISILVLAGCGGGSSSAPAPDPDPEPTSSAEQAALASDAVVATVIGFYSTAVEVRMAEGSISVIEPSVGVIKADGITEASSCAEGTPPSFVDIEHAVESTVQGASGGSCIATGEFVEIDDETVLTAKLDCTLYDDGNGLVLDGVFWMRSDEYGNISVTSDGLTSTTDGNECPLIINMTVSGSGNTATAGGCISECGSAFTVANRTQEVAGYCAGSAVSGFSSVFGGSCTYVDGTEPGGDDTFSYANLMSIMEGESVSDDEQLCFLIMACHIDGVGDCLTVAQVEVAQGLCGDSGGGDSCNAQSALEEGFECADYDASDVCEDHYETTVFEGNDENDANEGTRNCVWTEGGFCGSYMTLCEMEE
jgi:hypothetical protein